MIFDTDPVVEEDFVGFGIVDDNFSAEIIICLFDIEPIGNDEPIRQGMEIYVWFSYADTTRLNLSNFSFGEILELCHNLKGDMELCELVPAQTDEKTIEIALYRDFDIKTEDIKLAYARDLDSAFLRTLQRLFAKWGEISPILSGIETGQITSLRGVEMLLHKTTGIS